jgi:hypothetical protein
MSNPTLSAALEYAARGWKVFPLAPRSKQPLRGSRGFKDATTDEETIRQWWTDKPLLNLAVATGGQSGLVVIDVDLRHGGDASLFELERELDELPDTVQALTAGGWHLYFRHPGIDLKPGFGDGFPGLDIKADGAYVVAPPSLHPSGHQYQWKLAADEVELAELPAAFVELARSEPGYPLDRDHPWSRREATGARDNNASKDARGSVAETPLTPGQRHTGLVSLAGRLVNAGLPTDHLRTTLLALNDRHCDPPLPEAEIDGILRSAEQWEMPGGAGPQPATDRSPEGIRAVTGADLKALVRTTTWTWPGWIAEGHITVLAGETGAGKSWFALALAKAAADGAPWPDGQSGPEGEGAVFWLESEGRHAIVIERAETMGLDPARLLFMSHPFRSYYIDREDDFEQIMGTVEATRPRLVVVDSWSKALAGKENDADVRFALNALQGMARIAGMPVVLVHHLRKRQMTDHTETFDFDRLRGSSVLAHTATCLIGIDQPNRLSQVRRVSCGKASLGPMPDPFGFEITDLGLAFGAAPEPHQRQSKLDEAREFLREALADGARPAGEIKAEAREEGIADFTLRKARRELCDCHRTRGAHNRWLWELRDDAGVDAPPGHLHPLREE